VQRVQALNSALQDADPCAALPLSDALPDERPHQHLLSPRNQNDASPVRRSPSDAQPHVDDRSAAAVMHDDEVAGFLLARTLPETELRLASRFKDVNYDVSLCQWFSAILLTPL
jgi:hypothetical protein